MDLLTATSPAICVFLQVRAKAVFASPTHLYGEEGDYPCHRCQSCPGQGIKVVRGHVVKMVELPAMLSIRQDQMSSPLD